MDLIARLKIRRKCSNVFKVQRENYFDHRILYSQITDQNFGEIKGFQRYVFKISMHPFSQGVTRGITLTK